MAARPFARTAWARNLAAPVRDFLATETGGAAALLVAALAALVWANSPWSDSYESVWTTELSIRLGDDEHRHDLRDWVNEGLMTFFFLVVGLEAKRELDIGSCASAGGSSSRWRPRSAAWRVPSRSTSRSTPAARAPTAGARRCRPTPRSRSACSRWWRRGATRLRVRLLTMAVFDDLVALLIIATVYTEEVELVPLPSRPACSPRWSRCATRRRVAARAAVVLGVAFWVALLESGHRPGHRRPRGRAGDERLPAGARDLERVTELTRSFREQPTPELARAAQLASPRRSRRTSASSTACTRGRAS